MEMKYVVPDMAQSFGTLEFASMPFMRAWYSEVRR